MRTRALISLLAVLALVAACSGTPRVTPRALEKQVADQVNAQKLTPSSVVCADGLEAKIGATATCTLIANELKYTANLKATKVDGKKVAFSIKVPPPAIVPVKTLETQVTTALAKNDPASAASTKCPKALVGTTGKTATCSVTNAAGVERNVTVTVTTASFQNVAFDISSE